MIDNIILFPYFLALKLRHAMFDKGLRKVSSGEVPVICVGNVTVGGTGKTPHTEMMLRMLLEDPRWQGKNIAVLSRGYKRTTKGFQQVAVQGTAEEFGDEPLQIKKKFPSVTVAVDKDRVEGCRFLCHPEELQTSKKGRRCLHKDFPKADIIILDDAFQYRSLKADVSVVLVDYNRPVFKDHLMPMGRLRDLPERLGKADIVIVSKCPAYLEDEEREQWRRELRIKDGQQLYFTSITYDRMEPVFPEGEARYLYSKRLVLFTGIANPRPLKQFLSDTYKVVRHLDFPDHHKFTDGNIAAISAASASTPTAVVVTTEKDSQRIEDCKKIPAALKERLFRAPVRSYFLTDEEGGNFRNALLSRLERPLPESARTPDGQD